MNSTDFEFVVECCRSKDIKEKYVLHSYHSSDHQTSCDIGRLASGNSYTSLLYNFEVCVRIPTVTVWTRLKMENSFLKGLTKKTKLFIGWCVILLMFLIRSPIKEQYSYNYTVYINLYTWSISERLSYVCYIKYVRYTTQTSRSCLTLTWSAAHYKVMDSTFKCECDMHRVLKCIRQSGRSEISRERERERRACEEW